MTGLEANLGTTTVTVKKTGGSVEHPTCYDYSKYYLRKFKGGRKYYLRKFKGGL